MRTKVRQWGNIKYLQYELRKNSGRGAEKGASVIDKYNEGYSLTPNELDVLMHYYISPTPHPRLAYVEGVLNKFFAQGVLIPNEAEGTYNVTELGRAWIKLILSVPIPVRIVQYQDSVGNYFSID